MIDTENEHCPICKNDKLAWGKSDTRAYISPVDSFFSTGSKVLYLICKECGHIVRSKVVKPEKF